MWLDREISQWRIEISRESCEGVMCIYCLCLICLRESEYSMRSSLSGSLFYSSVYCNDFMVMFLRCEHWGWGCNLVGRVPSVLSSGLSLQLWGKLDAVLHVFNPSTREVEAEESKIDIILSQVFEILSQKQQKINQMKMWKSLYWSWLALASPAPQGLGFKRCVPPIPSFCPS